jgi:hypothetical protein
LQVEKLLGWREFKAVGVLEVERPCHPEQRKALGAGRREICSMQGEGL